MNEQRARQASLILEVVGSAEAVDSEFNQEDARLLRPEEVEQLWQIRNSLDEIALGIALDEED